MDQPVFIYKNSKALKILAYSIFLILSLLFLGMIIQGLLEKNGFYIGFGIIIIVIIIVAFL